MKLKAVITAAGPGQRHILNQTLTTHDGNRHSMVEFLLHLVSASVDQTAFVVPAGSSEAYQATVGETGSRAVFIEQSEPNGYAQAILAARDFVGDQPFLHLVGDHFYLADKQPPSTLVESLIGTFQQHQCSVSAVQSTRESLLPYFGAVGGRAVANAGDVKLFEVDRVIEKPTPTEAERELYAPGLRQGQYLCFFGMHVFTPGLMNILADSGPFPNLSIALEMLFKQERYLAAILPGRRFDIGAGT